MMSVSNHKTKVGIRPTIDGRLGGVRESLENQTLALAKAAARLITSSRYFCTVGSIDGLIS